METGITTTNGTGFEYCTADFNQNSLINCVQCFRASQDQKYLANFLIALEAGCQQLPKPGQTLALSGTVFNEQEITIGAPATVVPPLSGRSGLSIGAIIGIVFVCVLGLIILATIFLIRRRHKLRKATRGSKIQELNENHDNQYGNSMMRILPKQTEKSMELRIQTTGL